MPSLLCKRPLGHILPVEVTTSESCFPFCQQPPATACWLCDLNAFFASVTRSHAHKQAYVLHLILQVGQTGVKTSSSGSSLIQNGKQVFKSFAFYAKEQPCRRTLLFSGSQTVCLFYQYLHFATSLS